MGEKLSEMKRNLDWLDPQARPRQWLAEHQKKMAGLCKDERKRNGMADPVNGRRAAATRTTVSVRVTQNGQAGGLDDFDATNKRTTEMDSRTRRR
jgi:hypothetical protein